MTKNISNVKHIDTRIQEVHSFCMSKLVEAENESTLVEVENGT